MADKPPLRKPGRPKGSKTKPPDADALAAAAQAAAEKPPGNGDSAPGAEPGGSPRRRRISKKDTALIEAALTEILCAPAMPCAIFGDEWAADHFEQSGVVLAHKVAVVSERHPWLREQCMKALEGESIVVLGWAVLAYSVPPLIHFGLLPGPASIPRLAGTRRHKGEGSASEATEWPESAPEPAPGAEPTVADFSGEQNGAPPTYSEAPLP